MRLRTVFQLAAGIVMVCGFIASVSAQDASSKADLELTIRHLNGSTESFSKELAELQIVVGSDSMVKYIHLVLVSGNEKDTHAWYNMDNIVSFRYRFLAITGKGKVKLIRQDTFAVKSREGASTQIPLQEVDDFK